MQKIYSYTKIKITEEGLNFALWIKKHFLDKK